MGRYDDHIVTDYADYFAKWGPKGFRLSGKPIVPFWGLQTGYALKSGNNLDTSGTEPTNTTGRDAQVISFNTCYSPLLGTDPKAQMHSWYELSEDVWPFYIGGQQFGPPLLQLQDVQWNNYKLDATGRIVYVEAAITLREWWEGIELDMGWYTPPQADSSGLLLSGDGMFASGASDQDIIWSFLRMNGFSAAAAAGVMGNWERESGNHPDVNEVGGYGGYGLAQWTNTGSGSAARKTNLINWCNSNGYDYRSLEGQLNYFLYEFNLPSYSANLGAAYKAITDVWTATDRFLTFFEGCAVRIPIVGWNVRINAAYEYYNKYKDYVQVPSTVVETAPSTGASQAGDGITTGQFGWPFANGAGVFKQDLGPLYGGTSTFDYDHLGNDISTTGGTGPGSPVLAVDGGVVESVQQWNGSKAGNQSYGNCVVVAHSNGYYTRYAHLYSMSVCAGQSVSKGQQLGVEGNTGNSSGTHLHVELRQGSSWAMPPLNPQYYFHR